MTKVRSVGLDWIKQTLQLSTVAHLTVYTCRLLGATILAVVIEINFLFFF